MATFWYYWWPAFFDDNENEMMQVIAEFGNAFFDIEHPFVQAELEIANQEKDPPFEYTKRRIINKERLQKLLQNKTEDSEYLLVRDMQRKKVYLVHRWPKTGVEELVGTIQMFENIVREFNIRVIDYFPDGKIWRLGFL